MLCLMADNIKNEMLYRWRKTNHWTQAEAATRLGIDRAYYAKMETGAQSVSKRVMDLLAQNGVTETGESRSEGRPVSLVFGEMGKIPIVGSVAAGDGNTNVDYAEDEAWVPMSLQRLNGIGYVVDGESMMPALRPGDVAIFREMRTPRARYTYLIKTEASEYRVKNLEWKNNEWTLVSLNPNFRDEALGPGQLLGILIGWYRVEGKRETIDSNPDGLLLVPII